MTGLQANGHGGNIDGVMISMKRKKKKQVYKKEWEIDK